MVEYLLKLEYNDKDIMLFSLQKKSRAIAYIMYEDLNRQGTAEDFKYLNDENYFDPRNLIDLKIFPVFNDIKDADVKDDVMYIAETLIEHGGKMDCKINWIYDQRVTAHLKYLLKSKKTFIDFMLTFTENKRKTYQLKEDDFSHLNQNYFSDKN